MYDGWIVLYIVCKNNYIFLCRFLLFDKKYKKCFLSEFLYINWSVVYFIVVGGCLEILNFFEDNGLVIINEIINGLNIFDIVCLYGYEGFCKDLMSCDDLNLWIDKIDVYGWIIVYFVVMVGVYYVIDYLIEKNI